MIPGAGARSSRLRGIRAVALAGMMRDVQTPPILSRAIRGKKGTTHRDMRSVSARPRPSESILRSLGVHSRSTTAQGYYSNCEALARQIVLSAAEIG